MMFGLLRAACTVLIRVEAFCVRRRWRIGLAAKVRDVVWIRKMDYIYRECGGVATFADPEWNLKADSYGRRNK